MSNVIKSSLYVSLDDKKMIELLQLKTSKAFHAPSPLSETDAGALDATNAQADELIKEAEASKARIIADAEHMAEQKLREAKADAEELKRQADEEIASWWEGRRTEDDSLKEQVKGDAFELGYQEGKSQAEQDANQLYAEMLAEAKRILENAYEEKNKIILEAEAFLVELSCDIARKIIGDEIAAVPDRIIRLAKQMLSRRRDQGVVTLCVSPAHYNSVYDARHELMPSVNSEAELRIVPDSQVEDGGCIVRTEFGSIDARIDTQLSEIKNALLGLASMSEESDL